MFEAAVGCKPLCPNIDDRLLSRGRNEALLPVAQSVAVKNLTEFKAGLNYLLEVGFSIPKAQWVSTFLPCDFALTMTVTVLSRSF